MATPQAVSAVIRAARPDFKSAADKVVFAAHTIVSVNGFSLRKVGEGVDEAVFRGASALPEEEVDTAGWNTPEGGSYEFLYVPEPSGADRPTGQEARMLLLKVLQLADPPVDDSAGPPGSGSLLVSLLDSSSGRPPATLELSVDRYVPTLAGGGPGGYEHLDELIRVVQRALAEVTEGPQSAGGAAKAAKTTATTAAATASEAERRGEGAEVLAGSRPGPSGREARDDPLRDDRFPGGRGGGPGLGLPPGWGPAGSGEEDLMPGGLFRPPGLGGMGVGVGPPGGFVPLGPRGGGGGMHVGPENPIFADRLRHPRPGGPFPGTGGPGGGVPGMRWDPISPEGLQGWSPDDYTRGGRAHREEGLDDIGRPAPGRGPDWDNMFG